VHLFYFISCFCIDKIQKNYKTLKKKFISIFCSLFLVSVQFWKIRRRQCGRTQFLRSNALPPIPGRSRSCECPSRLCVRARPPDMTQCSSAFERTCITFELICKTAIFYCCANERAVLRSSAPLLPASTYRRQYVLFFFNFFCLFLFVNYFNMLLVYLVIICLV
jgi:hypothetical protein